VEFASKTHAAATKRAKYDNAALRDTTKMIYPAMPSPKNPLEFRRVEHESVCSGPTVEEESDEQIDISPVAKSISDDTDSIGNCMHANTNTRHRHEIGSRCLEPQLRPGSESILFDYYETIFTSLMIVGANNENANRGPPL
jgi:hypothetical protein